MFIMIFFSGLDLFMVGIAYAVYGGRVKYKDGMLLGVHIPSYAVEEPEVKAVLEMHRRNTKRFYIWNFILSVGVCFLYLWHFSIFMILWCLWMAEFFGGAMFVLFYSHRKLYDIKVKKGWCGASGTRIVVVDTKVSASGSKLPFPVWWHLPAVITGVGLCAVPPVWEFLQKERQLWIFILIFVSMEAVFVILHMCTNRIGNKVYSSDTKINKQVNQLEKRIYSGIWLISGYCNWISFVALLYLCVKGQWIGGLGLAVYISIQTLTGLAVLLGIFYLGYKKKEILSQDPEPFYVDNDVYWKNGWYSNPNDKRIWVQDQVGCDMNYTTNMASTGGKIFTFGLLGVVAATLIVMCVVFLKFDFTPVYLKVDQSHIEVMAPVYGVEIEPDEIKSVEVLESLPDDSVTKTNGFADGKQMLGKFRGKEMGAFKAYIYKGYSPVLKIELTDTTIYINSKDPGDVKKWYRELNPLLQK